jgi:hypothetical protein
VITEPSPQSTLKAHFIVRFFVYCVRTKREPDWSTLREFAPHPGIVTWDTHHPLGDASVREFHKLLLLHAGGRGLKLYLLHSLKFINMLEWFDVRTQLDAFRILRSYNVDV